MGGGDEHRKLYAAADVHASWKEVKCMCLYSTNTAFAQHNHDKYSLQINGQKPVDKETFERHVKLQADPRQIRSGACDIITISIG